MQRILRALIAAAVGAAAALSGVPPVAAAEGSVLYVVASPTALTAGEAAVRDRLVVDGLTVVLADDTAVTTAQAAGRAFVLVGHSVSSNAAATKNLRTVAVPVWVAKPWMFDDFGMTGPVSGTDYGDRSGATLTVTDATHPLAAGRSGTVTIQSGGKTSWGRPPASATTVARGGTNPAVFEIAAGEALVSGAAAPACRLTFPLVADAPATFTADGWAMFDAAAEHAAAGCVSGPPSDDPPQVSLTAPAAGATVSGTVALAATASDDTGVAQVRFAVDGAPLGSDTSAPYTLSWDTGGVAPGSHTVTATAEDSAGQTASSSRTVTVQATSTPSASVLLVVADPGALSGGDTAVRNRLMSTGYTVTPVDDAAVTPAQARAAAFVLVSQTVSSNGAAVKALAPLDVPVWVAKPFLFDDFGLTGRVSGTDFSEKSASTLTITAPGHPLAGGLSGTVTVQSGGKLSFGRPAAAATVVARAGTDAGVFTLAPGQAQATGGPAPACRLTFPLMANGPASFTAAGWTLFDAAAEWAATNCDTAGGPGPDPDPEPEPDGPVRQVLLVSIDGLNPDAITQLGPAGTPNLHRLIAQGASTLNARTVHEATQTLPNHTSMVTGRPVTVPGGHGVQFNEDDGSTVHVTAGGYVASIFDTVHDAGWATELYSGKTKFDFLDRSWNSVNGAGDVTGADDGRDKIDTYLRAADGVTTDAVQASLTRADPAEFTMLHYPGPDQVGHAQGYMSAAYLAEVSATDALVGELLDTVAGDAGLAASTVVIVTSDHGGLGTSHADAAARVNYTVPVFVWGMGVDAGADLYALNPDRADPGTGRPAYTGTQPVRNAEVGNLAAELLGLGPIAGSRINVEQSLDVG